MVIERPLRCDDSLQTLQALQSLGYVFHWQDDATIISEATREEIEPAVSINVGESGTTARLLTAVAALSPAAVTLSGAGRMLERPMQPLLDALQMLGVECSLNEGRLPIRIRGPLTRGGSVELDTSLSSQFLSALLLVAPCLEGGLQIHCRAPLSSLPYIHLTLQRMTEAGVEVHRHGPDFEVTEGPYRISSIRCEGDYSSVATLIAGALISGGQLDIGNLDPRSQQGDRTILTIAQGAGARVEWMAEDAVRVEGPSRPQAIDVDVADIPDLAPALAVVALFADQPSVLHNVERLRYKESDRLAAIIENVRLLGAQARLEGNSLWIEPGNLRPAQIVTRSDHRIAMSFALVGLRVAGVIVDDADCVGKSYPDFWRDLRRVLVPQTAAEVEPKRSGSCEASVTAISVRNSGLLPLASANLFAKNGADAGRIVLIGYRAAGKTSLAQRLSALLNWEHLETDALIEAACGLPIAAFVKERGWEAFRSRERDIVRELHDRRRVIIDCGGGLPEDECSMRLLAEGAAVIWVTAPADTIVGRLRASPHGRPALRGVEWERDVELTFAARQAVYERYAHLQVSTLLQSPDALARAIVNYLDGAV